MAQRRLRLGDILIEAGLIQPAQLTAALEEQKKGSKDNLGVILVRLGAVKEHDLVTTLAKQLDIPFASREKGLEPQDNPELAKKVPEEFARKHVILPISIAAGTLTVAMVDPMDLVLIDNLRLMTACHTIMRVIASRTDLEFAIDRFYGAGGMLRKAVEDSYKVEPGSRAHGGEPAVALDALVENADAAPVVKMTDLLIREAIKQRASDVHIEPFRDAISVRYRVDGVLRDVAPPSKSMAPAIVSRIKIMAKMDIAEKRLPQDGSFAASVDGRSIDFRVSTVPTVFGEKVVMRILDRSRVTLDLAALGFQAADLETLRKVIHKPYGLILVTGPTGSGKTTTLYAALSEIKGTQKNIMTIEDPVEYQMNGVNQVQARADIGLTFAVGLRSFLRQDPDVILVGEIRDLETAQICVRAALTGHLVFSTLHTNDASSAVGRLVDIGIEPFFVSSSLLAIVAQRLVRRLCPHCKESYEPPETHLPPQLQGKKVPIFRPGSCEKCNKSGYTGRLAIYEILTMNPEIEKLLSRHAPSNEILEAGKRAGMRTLIQSGYEKVLAGETTIEEVHSIAMA